jgi:hypothetical protein
MSNIQSPQKSLAIGISFLFLLVPMIDFVDIPTDL